MRSEKISLLALLSKLVFGMWMCPVVNHKNALAISLYIFLTGTAYQGGFAQTLRPAPAAVVLVAATVEGHAGTFLLDTGTERSCLDAGYAARLSLESISMEDIREPYGDKRADSISIKEFEIGSFHLQNVPMLATDLSAAFLKAGLAIDGVLGSDLLRQFIVTVNFSSGSAQFSKLAPPAVGAEIVKLQHVNGAYLVPVTLQGVPTRLLLDTGANWTCVSSQVWSRITTHWQPQIVLDGIRSTGAGNARFALVPRIDIAGSISRNVPLRIQAGTAGGLFADAEFEGLLGTDILHHFVLTLDLAHDTLYLVRDPSRHDDRYLYSTIGIQFAKASSGDFTVVAVWNPSPAAAAGLKIGDLIHAVNQADARRMSLDDLSRAIHGHPGSRVSLLVNSNGNRRRVSLEIRCLLCPTDAPIGKSH